MGIRAEMEASARSQFIGTMMGTAFTSSPWSPLSLGASLAAWYKADAGCYTDAACLFASASSQYLSRADDASLRFGDEAITVAAFVKHTTAVGPWGLVGKWGSGSLEYLLYYAASTRFRFYVTHDGSTVAYAEWSASTTSTAAFYHVVGYHDPATNVVGIIVNNGTPVTTGHTLGVFSGTSGFSVGRDENGVSYTDGSISRTGIWRRILTSAERTWLYNAGAGRFYADLGVAGTDGSDLKTSLVEYWNLCESTGSRVGSHAGLNLTPTNGPTVAAGPGEGLAVNNSPVKRWESQYGSKHVTQSDIAKQPLWIAAAQNGRAVLRGNGTSTYLTRNGALFSAQPLTIGAVVKYSTADAFEYVIDGDTGDRVIIGKRGGGSNAAQLYADSLLTGGLANAGGYKSQIAVVNGASSILRYGNAEVATGDAGAAKLGTDYNLMAGNAGGSAWLNGDLCEVVCASVAASAGVLTSMESYFRSRWGL